MKSILKLTSCHQKCPICWIIFLSENPSWSFIPSSTTIMNPPPGSTELPGSKASRWRRGGGSPSWDKICNGPVKGLKTEWQALPRGFRALQDSKTFLWTPVGGTVLFGWGRIRFPWKINGMPPWKLFFFSIKKNDQNSAKMISDHWIIKGLLHLQSLIHLCTEMLWCLASPQLRWSHEAPSNQPFFRGA